MRNELVYSDSKPEANMSIIPKKKSSTKKNTRKHEPLLKKNQMNKVLDAIF